MRAQRRALADERCPVRARRRRRPPGRCRPAARPTRAGRVHPQVIEVMRELGVDLFDRRSQRLFRELAERAGVVVTMGCGDACPYIPGKGYLDRDLQDPRGRPIGGCPRHPRRHPAPGHGARARTRQPGLTGGPARRLPRAVVAARPAEAPPRPRTRRHVAAGFAPRADRRVGLACAALPRPDLRVCALDGERLYRR